MLQNKHLKLQRHLIKATKSEHSEHAFTKTLASDTEFFKEHQKTILQEQVSGFGMSVFEYVQHSGKLDALLQALKKNLLSSRTFLNIEVHSTQYDQHYVHFITELIKIQSHNGNALFGYEICFLFSILNNPEHFNINTDEMEKALAQAFLNKPKLLEEDAGDALITESCYENAPSFYNTFFQHFKNNSIRRELQSINAGSLFQWFIENSISYQKYQGLTEQQAQQKTYENLYLHQNEKEDFITFCRKNEGFEKQLAIGYSLREGNFDHNYIFDADQKLNELHATDSSIDTSIDTNTQAGHQKKWQIDYLFSQRCILFRKEDTFFKMRVDDPFIEFKTQKNNIIIKLPSYSQSYTLKKEDFEQGNIKQLFNTLIDWQRTMDYNTCEESSLKINEQS